VERLLSLMGVLEFWSFGDIGHKEQEIQERM
jgi:hypothetical protein